MRIGFDVSDLATGRADGTTRYTQELAKRLPEMGREVQWEYFAPADPIPPSPPLTQPTPEASAGTARGADPASPREVTPVAGRSGDKGRLGGIQWHVSPWPKFWTQLRLPWDLYRFRPGVLFMPIQQLPILRPGKMKTVAVIHDLAIHYYPEQFTYKDWVLLHVFSAQAARQADRLICVSQATADDVTKFYGRTENMHVIHHGLDHEHFRLPNDFEREQSRQALEQHYPQLRQPFILFVGQIQPRKNIVRLVEAFERMKQGDLQLVIAGSHGWLQEPIKRHIRESRYANRIHLLGRQSDEALRALYWHAEVYVLPSLYEGFGLPILEAMACGCPVVTSNVSSMPEVSGEAAVLVDPLSGEAIARGITEAQGRREELRELGLKRAQEFTWEKTAEQTLKVLRAADK